MRPLQVGMIVALVVTSLAGILSNPLFSLANDSVVTTPFLHSAVVTQKKLNVPSPVRVSHKELESEVEVAVR